MSWTYSTIMLNSSFFTPCSHHQDVYLSLVDITYKQTLTKIYCLPYTKHWIQPCRQVPCLLRLSLLRSLSAAATSFWPLHESFQHRISIDVIDNGISLISLTKLEATTNMCDSPATLWKSLLFLSIKLWGPCLYIKIVYWKWRWEIASICTVIPNAQNLL